MTTLSSPARIGPGSRPTLASALWAQHRTWLLLLAASLVLRFIAMGRVVLVPEEAYYWLYAQHNQMSYFDHPPMVGWVIRAGTLIAGDTELGVRLVGGLLLAGASVLMYFFARMWFGRTAALIAAASLQVLPVYSGAALIATMDAPLVFFWLACLLGLSHALKHGRAAGWYLAGAALGLENTDVIDQASYDSVAAGLRVNKSVHAPLLCVGNVMDVASEDLS
jgi:dolichol-phosphate mannosyltransferase